MQPEGADTVRQFPVEKRYAEGPPKDGRCLAVWPAVRLWLSRIGLIGARGVMLTCMERENTA